jgi:hypothetical protein
MGGWAASNFSHLNQARPTPEYYEMMRQQMEAAVQAQRNAQKAYTQRPMQRDDVIDLDVDQWTVVEEPKQIEHK